MGEMTEKHIVVPKCIFNCDETQIITVQTPGKILAIKGRQEWDSSHIRSEGNRSLWSVLVVNSSCLYLFIFTLKRLTSLLKKDGSTGALYKYSMAQ